LYIPNTIRVRVFVNTECIMLAISYYNNKTIK